MMKTCFATFIFFFVHLLPVRAQHQQLRYEINQIARSCSGKIGVAISLMESGDTLTYHNEAHYVMQSVFKFPIAMAVLHAIDQGKLKLEQPVHITKADLPETYSSLRDKYPQGNVDVTVKELLNYMVTVSDNDACDILIKLLGGPSKVDQYMHQLGIKDIAVKVNEARMGANWQAQYSNWCQPDAQVKLLGMLYAQSALSKNSNDILWQMMLNTFVAPKRLRALLPPGTPLAHRTGTSGTNPQGLSPGTNDVGIVVLPNGKHLAIAVFITNSDADADRRDQVIAKIGKAAWDEFVK